MAAYTQPQTTKITTTTPVIWSNGSTFSGYVMFGIALPTDAAGAQWAQLNLMGTGQRLPLWTVVPVVEGAVDSNTSIFLTTALDPPNTRYAVYWYDNTWKLVSPFPAGTLPSLISVTTQPTYTITQPTLTVPAVPGAILTPAPQVPTSTATVGNVTYAVPQEYILTGTADGVNATFTIPVTPLFFASIFIDGQKQDPSTYSRVGAAVTFTTAPISGSSVSAFII